MRLQKFLAHAGVASRRKAEELIGRGEVRVNGKRVREMGTSVAESDVVSVQDRRVELPREHSYYLLNKPAGVVTTLGEPEGRRTVSDLIPAGTPRVVPAGRLDYDSGGLLLLTNDGELVHTLLHPRYGVEKTYRVLVAGKLESKSVAKILAGMRVPGERFGPARVRIVSASRERSVVDVTLREGKNREVRRMFAALGHPVRSLTRVKFGPLALGDLKTGAIRAATAREVKMLRSLASGARNAKREGASSMERATSNR